MGRQGFDAESFSGVMTSEQKVDAQFFGGDRSPVRRFAGNESVDSIRRARASSPIFGGKSSAKKEQSPRFGKSKLYKENKAAAPACAQLFQKEIHAVEDR